MHVHTHTSALQGVLGCMGESYGLCVDRQPFKFSNLTPDVQVHLVSACLAGIHDSTPLLESPWSGLLADLVALPGWWTSSSALSSAVELPTSMTFPTSGPIVLLLPLLQSRSHLSRLHGWADNKIDQPNWDTHESERKVDYDYTGTTGVN